MCRGLTSILGGLEGYWHRMHRTDRLPARAGSRRAGVDRRSWSVEGARSLLAHRIDLLMADSLAGRSLGRAVGIPAVVVDTRRGHRLEIGRSCAEEGSSDRWERKRSSLVDIDCTGPTW